MLKLKMYATHVREHWGRWAVFHISIHNPNRAMYTATIHQRPAIADGRWMISKLRMTLYVQGSWHAWCAALDNHHLQAGASAISSSATSLHATSREKNYVHLHTHSAGWNWKGRCESYSFDVLISGVVWNDSIGPQPRSTLNRPVGPFEPGINTTN